MTRMKLSVLDQSPIISGHTPREAIAQTLRLAQAAEQMGYYRYWCAEHHSVMALADPCPEILVTRLAAATSTIRVGTGGVLLPYYSPLKIAEQFRMLEALFPGRIDLGIGRAPGGDQRTARAVGGGQFPTADDFPQRVWELVGHLDGNLPDDHPAKRVRLQPEGPCAPQVWLLGSSDYSGVLAAQLGLRFAFAHFINAQGGDTVMRYFKDQFQPSAREDKPHTLLCCSVSCGETDAEGERMAKVVDLRRLEMAYNLDTPVPTQAMAEARSYTEPELAHIRSQRPRLIFGSAATCKAKLEDLAAQYQADEIMILTITGDYAARTASYERLAKAFGLPGA